MRFGPCLASPCQGSRGVAVQGQRARSSEFKREWVLPASPMTHPKRVCILERGERSATTCAGHLRSTPCKMQHASQNLTEMVCLAALCALPLATVRRFLPLFSASTLRPSPFTALCAGNQKLDFEEFLAMQPRRVREAYSSDSIEKWFQAADTNGDGTLSINEFFRWSLTNSAKKYGAEALQTIFEKYDQDRSVSACSHGDRPGRPFCPCSPRLTLPSIIHALPKVILRDVSHSDASAGPPHTQRVQGSLHRFGIWPQLRRDFPLSRS